MCVFSFCTVYPHSRFVVTYIYTYTCVNNIYIYPEWDARLVSSAPRRESPLAFAVIRTNFLVEPYTGCVCVCVCFAHCKISWYVQQPLNWLNTIMYLSICLFTFFSSPLFHHFLSFFLFIIIVIIIIIIIPHYYILCLVASIVQCLWLSFFSFFFLAQKDTVFVQSSRVYYAACQTCN